MLRGVLLGVLGVFLVACEGVIGGAGGGPRLGDDVSDPATVSPSYGYASEATLLRLSKRQHQRTVEDLLGHFLGNEASAVLAEIEPAYAIIPDDSSDLDIGGLSLIHI